MPMAFTPVLIDVQPLLISVLKLLLYEVETKKPTNPMENTAKAAVKLLSLVLFCFMCLTLDKILLLNG